MHLKMLVVLKNYYLGIFEKTVKVMGQSEALHNLLWIKKSSSQLTDFRPALLPL